MQLPKLLISIVIVSLITRGTLASSGLDVDTECKQGVFNTPVFANGTEVLYSINITSVLPADEPTFVLLPNFPDSGSIKLGDTTGLKDCRTRVFDLKKVSVIDAEMDELGLSLVENQNQTTSLRLNPRDDTFIGNHTVELEARLNNYYLDGPVIAVKLNVHIEECKVKHLKIDNLGGFQDAITLYEVPRSDIKIDFPRFSLSPTCGKTDEDISFSLQSVGEDTKLPNWLKVDRTGMEYVTISRTQVYLMQKVLNNNIYQFKLTTKIDDLDLDFNLLVSFEDIVIEEED